MLNEIVVKKAAQHNLKRIDVRLPRNRFIVVTGPSGSGKSSLAFDTLFAEGQRRYIECMSAYARQYMEMMEKPDVESIEGLSPAISIEQKTISSNPRSTVGTVTEMYDLLRLLFARAGIPHCPSCGRAVSSQSTDQIIDRILDSARGRIKVMAPVIKGRKGEYHRLFDRLRKKGYLRLRLDGVFRDLEDEIILVKTRSHTGEVQIDDLRSSASSRGRLQEAVERALELTDGEVLIIAEDGAESYYSRKLRCPVCDVSLPDLEPRNFSFNSPYGACPRCHGLGFDTTLNEDGETELTGDRCPSCEGARLNPRSLAVRIDGRNIHDMSGLSIDRLIAGLG
ncbi:MAG: ABC-ATPase UvrA, partial [Acidobacteria bacterium]|nr:ABC-ATPase UvrA [Acidobacteriota bacterium]